MSEKDIILDDICECGHEMIVHNFIHNKTALSYYNDCSLCDCAVYLQHTPKKELETPDHEYSVQHWLHQIENAILELDTTLRLLFGELTVTLKGLQK